MLRPSKHAHPDRTVISAAVMIISRLRDRRADNYDELRQFLRKRISGTDAVFLPAINLLFLLGKVEYRPKNDSIEYIGK